MTILTKMQLVNHLKSLLDYRQIYVSDSELNSYSIKELKFLINKYRINLINIDSPDNTWYGPRKYYMELEDKKRREYFIKEANKKISFEFK